MAPQTLFEAIAQCCQSSWTSLCWVGFRAVARVTVLHLLYPQLGPSSSPPFFGCTLALSVQLCLTFGPSKGGLIIWLYHLEINLFLQLYPCAEDFYSNLFGFMFSHGFQHHISDFFWKIGKCFHCLILKLPKLEHLETNNLKVEGIPHHLTSPPDQSTVLSCILNSSCSLSLSFFLMAKQC